MTINRTTLLDLPLPVTGTESGVWGDVVNNGLSQYIDISVAGSLSLSADSDTNLSSTEGDASATNIGSTTAQYAILRCTGARTATRNINAPAWAISGGTLTNYSKIYIVVNETTGSQNIVLRATNSATPTYTTGVTIVPGERAVCAWNGSDFVKVGGAAGGSTTQVQFNNAGVFGGITNATTDGTTLSMTSPKVITGINDTNGNELLKVTATASAVNELTLANAATGGNPVLSATGGDTNIGITLTPKGTGGVVFPAGAVGTPAITTTGDTNTGVFFPAADTVALSTGGSERMRIDSSGNVGIGVTPSTWTVFKAIEYGAAGNALASYADENRLTTNAYYNSGWKYGYSAAATSYQQTQGIHIWSNAASGTAGNSITFTERMRIDSSGNVGIGATPSAWISTVKALDINTGAAFVGTSNAASVWSNTFIDSGSNYRYKTTAAAAYYSQSSGAHAWYAAASGSAGSIPTFTQILNIEKDKSLALQGATSQTGTGITFPATQSASSNANTLDDYEEGTWTTSFTYSNASAATLSAATYTKVGRLVTLSGKISATLTTTNTAISIIFTLPFTQGANLCPSTGLAYHTATATANAGIGFIADETGAAADKAAFGAPASQVTKADNSSFDIQFSYTYEA